MYAEGRQFFVHTLEFPVDPFELSIFRFEIVFRHFLLSEIAGNFRKADNVVVIAVKCGDGNTAPEFCSIFFSRAILRDVHGLCERRYRSVFRALFSRDPRV